MEILKKYMNLLWLSGISCFVAGLSLLFIPLADMEGTKAQKGVAVLLAALFWAGLIAEIIFFVIANKQCNSIEERLIKRGSKTFKNTKIGLITFFSCREAMFADIASILTFIIMIVMIILKVTNDWLFVIPATAFFFSFNLHCFLNGRNYKYYKTIQNYIKKQGAKKDE